MVNSSVKYGNHEDETMSRIGKLPVILPEGVTVVVKYNVVTIKGPKGELTKTFDRNAISIVVEENQVVVRPTNRSSFSRAMHGTARAIIYNMVEGLTKGFEKYLKISGVGFRAVVKGKMLELSLGFSHGIEYPIPDGITITVTENTNVKVEGADKELVGKVTASIKQYYPVEPYKAKGISIVGEFIRRKEGKKTA